MRTNFNTEYSIPFQDVTLVFANMNANVTACPQARAGDAQFQQLLKYAWPSNALKLIYAVIEKGQKMFTSTLNKSVLKWLVHCIKFMF